MEDTEMNEGELSDKIVAHQPTSSYTGSCVPAWKRAELY